MKYQIEKWQNRTVFIFKNNLKKIQEFTKMIDQIIQPVHKSEIQITS